MPLVVKVIAHTTFIGVPTDLLPMAEARSQAEAGEHPNFTDARALGMVRTKDQDKGTDAERLIECAGRTCYDSYGKGRDSNAYHQHIMDVDHGSVTEHASLSFFLSGISRGLTHELVRHRVGVAISQRSTRYVDESASEWVWHPLIDAYQEAHKGQWAEDLPLDNCQRVQRDARNVYDQVVKSLESWMVGRGTDKLTARKQARGAARGLLGNALMTEMVWTCNLRALKTVLAQRAKAAADAEIRVLANRLYEEALPYWPTYLGRYEKRPCPDGIGYELVLPKATP